MCIIAIKPKGISLQDEDVLKNCFKNNSDGAGYSFELKHKVIIKKGFMSFKEFYNSLIKDYEQFNLENKNIVMHFRIGTSGGINKEKTHPFMLTDKPDLLNGTSIKCSYSIAHNGILSDFDYKNSKLSDTQNFIKDFLYPFLKLVKFDFKNPLVKMVINSMIGNSKLAILSKNGSLNLYGDFIKDGDYYYSNSTYKPPVYSSWKYYYDRYDDYYNDNYYTNFNKYHTGYTKIDHDFLLKDGSLIQVFKDSKKEYFKSKNGFIYEKIDGNYSYIGELAKI